MIDREIAQRIVGAAKKYPVIILTGARQTGKTTLCKELFKGYEYISLEEPDIRNLAQEDPRFFFNRFRQKRLIIDEVQRVPELLSYIQSIVDENNENGKFILTGSQNFLLLEKVGQSLAGRASIFNLPTFTISELFQTNGIDLSLSEVPEKVSVIGKSLDEILFSGFYPRIHDKKLDPQDWLMNYYTTYLERDVRLVTNIGDLDTFGKFVALCAGRSGSLLDMVSIGNDCGVSHSTIKRWLSILQASFLITLLPPYYKNFNKRIIKNPKIYFLDTGLLCYLLRIRQPESLYNHAMRGAIFENFIIAEFYKKFFNSGLKPDLYFWRDSGGYEIDLLIEYGGKVLPVELKSSATFDGSFTKNLDYWNKLVKSDKGYVIYGGEDSFTYKTNTVLSWKCM